MGIPILMYHEVGPIETVTERYTVPETMFRQQLQYLHDCGYQTISLEQYHDSETEHSLEAGGRKVIITFDDNNLCHYSVSTPILLDFGCRATFFVVSGLIDTRPDTLTSAHLMQMKKAGMFIESHSHTHRFLSDLGHKDLRDELETSRGFLQDRLQTEVRFISCPGGRYSSSVLDSALDVGYFGVCTSAPGLNEFVRGEAPKVLNRFLVSATTTLETFKKIVGGDKRFVRGQVLRHRVKGLVKELLGNERYDRLWRRYRKDL